MPPMMRPPSGPRAARGGQTNSNTTHGPSRGGIQKRRGGLRTDKDGDLDMDAAGSAKNRHRKGRNGAQNRGDGPPGGREALRSVPGRGALNGAALQKAIIRGLATGDAKSQPRSGRSGVRGGMESVIREASGKAKSGLDQIRVVGWRQSKAANNSDGGIKDLLAFLERKATGPDTPARDAVRIKKSRAEGDALIVFVRPEDAPKILRLDTFMFAGVALKIDQYQEASAPGNLAGARESPDAIDVKQKLSGVLSRRYDPALKLLNLSALGTDSELVSMGMFQKESTQSKFFPALMKVCDTVFQTAQQKRDMVESITLSANELPNLTIVTTLSQTFPDIKNLDLSNNKFTSFRSLENWKKRFPHLDHLVLTGNPLTTSEPQYKDELMRWYPTLRFLDGNQIRSDEEVATIVSKRNNQAKGVLPIAVQGPSFRDEVQIAENFIKNFFPAYDTDRASLANGFYDAQSQFSLSVNTSAPRAPQQGHDMKTQTWDAYIKKSRNIMKINHLPARMSRLHTGTDNIRDVWLSLPVSRHPNLAGEPQKWLVECHSLPGLPDPSGQSPGGVGGLIVTVHSEFEEMDVSTGQVTIRRSFDRTFVLGPGSGVGGIRVISDTMVLRAYGGHEAWMPEGTGNLGTPALQQPQISQFPEGFGMAMPGKPDEQVQQEVMVGEMSARTKMTLEYSKMCLEQAGWNFEAALTSFESAKEMLPPNAFLHIG
ncbi:MAG: hypothetical protein M1819_002558 [Sarea resinae]|nr:MAG: hypothetical protein M1819_002558 [Sarea resinae]